MENTDWSFVSLDQLPPSVKIYIDYVCNLQDIEACLDYVVRLPRDFQLAAVKRILHQLEGIDEYELEFLQKYLATAPAVQQSCLLKIRFQFMLGHRFYSDRKRDLARQVYEEIRQLLDDESSIPEETMRMIRLKLKVDIVRLRVEEDRNKRGDDVDVTLADNEVQELLTELELLSNEVEQERSEFDNYCMFRSFTTWIRIMHAFFKREPDRVHLDDLITWVKQTERVAPSQESDKQLLSMYALLLSDLYFYKGVEPVTEIQEYYQKFKSTFDRIYQQLQLVEPDDQYKALNLVGPVKYFAVAVLVTRILKRRPPRIPREEFVSMIQTTLRLARSVIRVDQPVTANLLITLLDITSGDEQLDYEELSVFLLDNIDKNLTEVNEEKLNESFLHSLFHAQMNLGSFFQRTGRKSEATRHYRRASEINDRYSHLLGEETYNKQRQKLSYVQNMLQ